MKRALSAFILLTGIGLNTATAQEFAANDGYRTCPVEQTQKGMSVVRDACGTVERPAFSGFNSLGELQASKTQRDQFATRVSEYGSCVTSFINSYRRPGADANSTAPDEAACAHSWAEDQITQTVMEYGRACIDFSNRSMTDPNIKPWSGACYPTMSAENG